VSTAAAGTAGRTGWPRRRVLVALLVVSAALNFFFIAGAVWTRLQAPAGWPGPEQRFRQMAAGLDLDAQQRISFDTYAAAMRARSEKMHQQIAPLIGAVWDEIAKPQPDMGEVARLFDEAAEKRGVFQREATVATVAFLSVLSPAQRSKFVANARARRAAGLRRHHPPH